MTKAVHHDRPSSDGRLCPPTPQGKNFQRGRSPSTAPLPRVITAVAFAASDQRNSAARTKPTRSHCSSSGLHPRGGSWLARRRWCSWLRDCPCPDRLGKSCTLERYISGQVLDDGVGAALAELVVVISRSDRIGVAFDLNDVMLLAAHLLRELVECLFVLAR